MQTSSLAIRSGIAALCAVAALSACKKGDDSWIWQKNENTPRIINAADGSRVLAMTLSSVSQTSSKCDTKTLTIDVAFSQRPAGAAAGGAACTEADTSCSEKVTLTRSMEQAGVCTNDVRDVQIVLANDEGTIKCEPARGCSGTVSARFPNNNGVNPTLSATFSAVDGTLSIVDVQNSNPKS